VESNGRLTIFAELDQWLEANWDPRLPLGEWWKKLAEAGWSQPQWPVEWYGRGLSSGDAQVMTRTIREFGAVTGPVGFATGLVAPTVLVHGTDEQKARHLPGMVYGIDAYCQLFSEPNAGSDLAGLQCRAERDGDTWVVNGQKVWTSGGQIANKAMLLARTNIDVPKHAGISYFIVDVRQPGVEIRPLREMTGRSFFNEVFLTDARVRADDLIGGEGNGWAVTNTTLAFERSGAGGGEAGATADPGPIAGNLDVAAGRFSRPGSAVTGGARSQWATLSALAAKLGRNGDPLIRDGLVRLYTLERLNTLTSQRARSLEQSGESLPGLPQMAKMAQNHALRLGRDLTFRLLQAAGTLHDYDGDAATIEQATGIDDLESLVETALFAQGPPIYGGTDQIQRNILGERTLGLPREPSAERGVAFRDLLKN
jgi:alkylation response protein AidB-like acyl-CoA dehydrogenase